jgi:hypothetical protein
MHEENYICPGCAAANTQRVSLAFLAGSNTALGAALSPPKKKTWLLFLLVGLALLILTLRLVRDISNGSAENSPPVWWFGAGMAIIGMWAALFAIGRYSFNRSRYPLLLRDWQSEFICLRCSKRFIPTQLGPTRTINSSPKHELIEQSAPLLTGTVTLGEAPPAKKTSGKRGFIIIAIIGASVILVVLISISFQPSSDRRVMAPIVDRTETPQEPPTQSSTKTAKADGKILDKRFVECLLPKAQSGEYSSFDGGKSARRLLEEGCGTEYLAYTDRCIASGYSEDNCVTRAAIIAQSAIKQFGK